MTHLILALLLMLNPSKWTFSSAGYMDSYKYSGGLAFDFPVDDAQHQHINYFWTKVKSMSPNTVTAQFQVVATSGNPTFNYQFEPENTCTTPATVRLILGRNDVYTSADPDNRWWSNPTAALLVPGAAVQLQVPLTSSNWTNVNGQTSDAGLLSAVNNPGYLGFSFGGGCFFGHGVNVSGGTAQFVVWGYSVN